MSQSTWSKTLAKNNIPVEHLSTSIKKDIQLFEKAQKNLAILKENAESEDATQDDKNDYLQANNDIVAFDETITTKIEKYAKKYPENYEKNKVRGERLKAGVEAKKATNQQQTNTVTDTTTVDNIAANTATTTDNQQSPAPVIENEPAKTENNAAKVVTMNQQQTTATQNNQQANNIDEHLKPKKEKTSRGGKIFGSILITIGIVAAAVGIRNSVNNN